MLRTSQPTGNGPNSSQLTLARSLHRYQITKPRYQHHQSEACSGQRFCPGVSGLDRRSAWAYRGIRGSCHVLTPVCVWRKYTWPCTVVLCSTWTNQNNGSFNRPASVMSTGKTIEFSVWLCNNETLTDHILLAGQVVGDHEACSGGWAHVLSSPALCFAGYGSPG